MGSSCKCIVLIGNKVYGISHCCKSQVRSFDLCLVRGISACDIACIVTNMPRQSNNLRKTNFWVCEIPLLTANECNQLGQTVLYSITMRAWSLLYSEWAWTFSIAKKKKKRTMGLGSANYHIVRPCSLMPFFWYGFGRALMGFQIKNMATLWGFYVRHLEPIGNDGSIA